MLRPDIKTSRQVVPMIYGYSTPEVMRHNGWTKIGYTEQEVETRIKQQTHTADVSWHLEWKGNATFDDGSGQTFTDKDFHAYLRKAGVEQEAGKNNEWFHISGQASKQMFRDFREDHGILKTVDTVIPYKLREEQERAVEMTVGYQKTHKNGEFLWNAKPRFGKTLSVYELAKRMGAANILIVTNRPAIANSWYSDYAKFIGRGENGYFFVSSTDSVKNNKDVISYEEYFNDKTSRKASGLPVIGMIYFVSLQDLKGSLYFGGDHDKLKEISTLTWDILVVDEAHEGVDTYKTDAAFDHIKRNFTLHLSGTPFKALAGNKFNSDAIFNWTYTDEQDRKRKWDNSSEEENPYEALPKLNLYTYQMSEIIKDELSQGIEINGETKEYAFDLNEFFAVSDGKFIHDSSVDKFLDALTKLNKYPFSTPELRNELKHTFWLLNRVDSARALAKKLREHPVFQDYKVIEAVGNGKDDDSDETKKSYDKVVKAIAENDKTITLSVGQLTTGVTIPEWTAVLMLSNMKSPALYMQAAFRAQNPCLFKEGTQFKRKENSYVFDFDPARTLTIYEEFANNLNPDTAGGSGTAEKRKENIRTLLNFFPVIGEDEQGELVELDAEKVLTIPRKIKSVEVVKRGFMSNFLFSNISNIFGASGEVLDIIRKLSPVEEPKNKVNLTEELKKNLSLDENGEVSLSEELIKEKVQDIFGNKIYDVTMQVNDTFSQIECEPDESKKAVDRFREILKQSGIKSMVEHAKDFYGLDIKASDKRQIEARLNHEADKRIDRMHAEYQIQKNVLEKQRVEAQQSRDITGKSPAEIEKEFEEKKKEAFGKFREELSGIIADMAEESARTTVETVETNKREREKDSVMDVVRDRLRGFSRTIPSFLMAYGDDTVTLENFDTIIPGDVFKEVTGVTLDEFRLLRDGGDYTDEETGEPKHFNGQLFDSLVFNDSVKEFLSLKKKLANYFDENNTEDIFDYIPPQKTNQIFTPKAVVKKMVDMLEKENPGCFDMPDKTFIDLYMKSGLYIAEIVKRLYRSEAMKKRFPDGKKRLRHIFEKQVYGLAPTEIIYRISTNYILGFNEESKDIMHNFRQVDALPYAKDGTLSKELDKLYSAQK